jgi:hypothetical protein
VKISGKVFRGKKKTRKKEGPKRVQKGAKKGPKRPQNINVSVCEGCFWGIAIKSAQKWKKPVFGR